MAACKDGNHHFVDNVVHADDRLAQFGDDLVPSFAEFFDGLDVFSFVLHELGIGVSLRCGINRSQGVVLSIFLP